MNRTFKTRAIALELAMNARTSSTERARLEDKYDALMNSAWDEAYIRACELDSPNSPDFDALHERIYEEMFK